MRRIMTWVLTAIVLNCSINMFANTSSQDDSVNTNNDKVLENIELSTISSLEELDVEDASGFTEILTEEDAMTLPNRVTEETAELLEGDMVSLPEGTTEEDTMELAGESTEEDTGTLPNIITEEETAILTEELREEITTTSSEELMEEYETESSEELTEEYETESSEELTEEYETESSEELMEEYETESSEELTEIELSPEKDYIYNVSFPASTTAYLDPGNLSGKGQIFSNEYIVENYSNTDIVVRIKNIEIRYHSTEDLYEFTKDEIIDSHSTVRKLNVDMIWRNEDENTEKILNVIEGSPDEYVLLLRAAEYDENGEFVSLNNGSTGLFYFTGTLNSNTNIVWKENDITVSFDYEIVNAQEEEIVELVEEDIETENETEESSSELTQENIEMESETEENSIKLIEEDMDVKKEEQESTIE